MPIFHARAILFDLDGVLVNSTPSVTRQWRIWAGEHGIGPDEVVEIAHGRRTVETVRLLAPHLDAEAEVRKLEAREAADTEGVTVMPGAAELVNALPGGCWAVVTSGTRRLALARLLLAQVPIPLVLVSADDVTQGKPNPAPYLQAAQKLGMDPGDCLVIEDAPAGIRAAHAGNMRVIALPSTYPRSALREADAVVGGLADIRIGAEPAVTAETWNHRRKSMPGILRVSVPPW